MNRRGTRSYSSRWCFLRDEDSIRDTVRALMKIKGLTITQLSKGVDIPIYRISQYLNSKREQRITQFQLIEICNYLGFEVDVSIKFK